MKNLVKIAYSRIFCGFIFAIAGFSLLSESAVAFSPGPSHLWPSNYELVKAADDIVLVRATHTEGEKNNEQITFVKIKSYKEKFHDRRLTSWGSTDPEYYRGPSKDDTFEFARPGAHSGMGTANDYQIGKCYLLFLNHFLLQPGYPMEEGQKVGDRVWQVGLCSLSRDREEVSLKSSPWVQAVEEYIRIARLNDYEKEKSALHELRKLADADTMHQKYPAALVADIDRHFVTISQYKSYEDLLAFRPAEGKPLPETVYYALAQSFEPRAFDLLQERFKDISQTSYWLEYLAGVSHPERLQEIATLWEKWRTPPVWADLHQVEDYRRDIAYALTTAAADADYGVIIKALWGSDLDKHSGQTLLRWFADHITPGALADVKKIVGTNFKDSKWLPTLITLGDEDVIRWAISYAKSNELDLATMVALSPTDLADDTARNLISSGKVKDLKAMVMAYTNNYTTPNCNPHRWDRMRDIITSPDKSAELVNAIKDSLNPLFAENTPSSERFEELRKLLDLQLKADSKK